MSEEKIKVGIVGAGSIAPAHVEAYRKIPWVELVGVADIDASRAKRAAAEWGLPKNRAFTDYHELLELKPDAISVCTWHAAHAQVTIDALNAGINVLVEKPMAPTGEEAYAMYRAAVKSGKVLMVGFQSRFNPELVAAKRFVDSGFLGKAYFAEAAGGEVGARRRGIPGESFTRLETAGGGVTLDIGVYALDTALYLLGYPDPISVSAATYAAIGNDPHAVGAKGPTWAGVWDPSKFEVEDFSSAFIRLEGGISVVYKQAWAMHAETLGNPLVLGNKGGLSLSPLRLYTDMNGYMVNITPAYLPKVGQFETKIREFIRACRGEVKNPIDPYQMVELHALVDAIYRSSERSKEASVTLPPKLAP